MLIQLCITDDQRLIFQSYTWSCERRRRRRLTTSTCVCTFRVQNAVRIEIEPICPAAELAPRSGRRNPSFNPLPFKFTTTFKKLQLPSSSFHLVVAKRNTTTLSFLPHTANIVPVAPPLRQRRQFFINLPLFHVQ